MGSIPNEGTMFIKVDKEQPKKNGTYTVQLNDGSEYWASFQTGKSDRKGGHGKVKKATSRSKKRGWQRLVPSNLKVVSWWKAERSF